MKMERKNAWKEYTEAENSELEKLNESYRKFLDAGKTERECVKQAVAMAEAAGYLDLKKVIEEGKQVKAGDKLYAVNMKKSLALFQIGKQPLEKGMAILGAHIDSPRLDIKQNPLYEDTELAYLDTHYYGGIKKYQWVAIPLALHGVIVKKSGEKVFVNIGEADSDPVFCISDLLPHLAQDQMKKDAAKIIEGEELNLIIGGYPLPDTEKEPVKASILKLLKEKYGVEEEDFLSAELAAVPAFDVCEIGLDRSLIGGYGHDDRVCAYAELKAIFDVQSPARTCVCILADKEETGSDGVTGMQSAAFDCFMEDLCAAQGVPLRRCYENSFCLSADVTNAYDPLYPEVSEKRSDSKVNYGMAICKFTGARGKSGTSDASAEVVAYLRRLFEKNSVVWQLAALGKVDQGGGGTIAKFMANRNIDTIDAGVPVLSMHAPFEVVAKLDCYMTYKGVLAAYSDR